MERFRVKPRLLAIVPLLLLALLPAAVRADVPTLRIVRTDHYRIHTDLDVDLANDLAKRMDAMYGEYQRRLADFAVNNERPPLEVYLFAEQEDYLRFTGEKLKNTGGVYMPGRNLLAAFLEGQGRDGLRRTIQHEAFHQFAFNAISQDVPVWLNEGLAQLFEEGIWTGEKFWLGQAPPRRIRQLQADLKAGRIVDFETFLRMSPEQWGNNLNGDHDAGATQYNQSWAMTYFLVNATGKDGQPKYRARLINMLRLLNQGEHGDAAFRQAFSDNLKGFQARFLEFANALEPTDEATLMERASVLGDLLGELTKRNKRFKSVDEFKRAAVAGRYRMHYTKGELTWQSDPDWKVYFADAAGKALTPAQHYFEPRAGAVLPDLVSASSPRFRLRTRFFKSGDKFEHEVLVEPPAGKSRAESP